MERERKIRLRFCRIVRAPVPLMRPSSAPTRPHFWRRSSRKIRKRNCGRRKRGLPEMGPLDTDHRRRSARTRVSFSMHFSSRKFAAAKKRRSHLISPRRDAQLFRSSLPPAEARRQTAGSNSMAWRSAAVSSRPTLARRMAAASAPWSIRSTATPRSPSRVPAICC